MTRPPAPEAELLGVSAAGCTVRWQVGRDRWSLTLDDVEGAGVVIVHGAYLGATHAVRHAWPLAHRGTPSLVRFLLESDVYYLAGKFGVGEVYMQTETEAGVRRWVAEHCMAQAVDLLRDLDLPSESEWSRWCERALALGVSEPWEAGMHRGVDPAFARLYAAIWPALERERDRVERALYGPARGPGAGGPLSLVPDVVEVALVCGVRTYVEGRGYVRHAIEGPWALPLEGPWLANRLTAGRCRCGGELLLVRAGSPEYMEAISGPPLDEAPSGSPT